MSFFWPLIFCFWQLRTTTAFSGLSSLSSMGLRHPSTRKVSFTSLFSTDSHPTKRKFASRFHSTSPADATIDTPCLITIDKKVYDVQAFAKAHPGGSKILQKFHQKDATLAFDRIGHSEKAREMLKAYEVKNASVAVHVAIYNASTSTEIQPHQQPSSSSSSSFSTRPLWRQKLFTDEDPMGYHKYLGVFCLWHYVFRYYQLFAGTAPQFVKSKWLALWLLPHLLLNASAFLFHTVPKERIVGSPMIWKEYRVHNLILVARSIVCTLLISLSMNMPSFRNLAVVGSVTSMLASNMGADITTQFLQPTQGDSSVGTLPFWKGCSLQTQQRFKLFYAYCQFMATMACLMVSYPLWPFAVMMPIQFSSILLTLVRKSLLGAKGWHVAYLVSLLFPFAAAAYPFVTTWTWDAPLAFLAGTTLFGLRCWGVSKYWLWGVLGALRIFYGDMFIRYDLW